MKLSRFSVIGIVVAFFLSGCSSTVLNESWKSPEYSGKLESVYIIGVARNDATRRIFEDSFNKSLAVSGVKGFVSYRDFTNAQKAEKDEVQQKAKDHNAGAMLVTRMVKKETETVVSPGRISTYSSGGYYASPYYQSYGAYYPRRYETIYEPPTVSQYEIATIESNIYDTTTGELIWGARLETTVEGNRQKMIDDFIKVVVKDLQSKGLI